MAVKARTDESKAEILKEARARFKRCVAWEATARARFRDDLKFAEGDAYNGYQWPTDVMTSRTVDKRPMLTINRVRQHCLDILNDARQSKVSIKVRPVRGGASYDAAQILEGVIKHIEYISNADAAYQRALGYAVRAGIGWCRIVTDYAGDDTFDQEIFIRPVKDPLSVYLDPDITEFDGSDARFGFVFTEMPKDEFEHAYPEFKGKDPPKNVELDEDESWVADKVRIAEYFRCVQDKTKLYAFTDPTTGEQVFKTEKEIDKELMASVVDNPDTMVRSIMLTKVEHFTLIGDEIGEEKEWPGRYIPLLRCVGEETVIEGQLDRKGHTRALLDSQRMMNYNASASVEFGALQSKIPYIGAVESIEGYEENWNNANTSNASLLPYKSRSDDGTIEYPAPARQPPPMGAPVFMQGFRDAVEQMYLASGQNQADFGQPGNEKSGVAIQQRQRQGDNATYHYLDHQAMMVRFAGKQLIDLIPKVYDTPRMVKMRDDAGKETDVKIDPDAPEPVQKEKSEGDNETATLNPNIGTYDVVSDVGPAYATRRQEAFAAWTQILSQNKELINVIGDIALRFSDFPGGLEAAERLRRLVPAQALQDGPPPDVVALQGQLQQMDAIIKALEAKVADKMADHLNDQERNAIEEYKAQSGRLSALTPEALGMAPEEFLVLVKEAISEAIQTSGAALAPAIDTEPYIPPEAAAPPMQPPPGGPPGPPMMAPEGAPPEMMPPPEPAVPA